MRKPENKIKPSITNPPRNKGNFGVPPPFLRPQNLKISFCLPRYFAVHEEFPFFQAVRARGGVILRCVAIAVAKALIKKHPESNLAAY